MEEVEKNKEVSEVSEESEESEEIKDRPSWKNYFAKICRVTSERSACERLKVGCLLVKDNRIISQGYNGFLPGCPHKSIVRDNHEQATIHAEQNAIADCAKRGVCCLESEAYITHYPCIICTRILLASGISKIYYLEDYKNDELVEYFCNQINVKIEKIFN
jgi:dCMP deaminase